MNTISLVGRLTAKPELRVTRNEQEVTELSVACDRRYYGKGERQTDFFKVVVWGPSAKFICEYGDKGNLVHVVGELQIREYTNTQGAKVKSYEIKCEEIRNLTPRKQQGDYEAVAPDPFGE